VHCRGGCASRGTGPSPTVTQGHDLQGTLGGPGAQGRHPSSLLETNCFEESFPAPKPARKDGDRPKPYRETVAGAFPHVDSPSAKKSFRKAFQQPHRGASLSGVHPAGWRAPQVHGFFRGQALIRGTRSGVFDSHFLTWEKGNFRPRISRGPVSAVRFSKEIFCSFWFIV
jgi:hypothetical protein